MILIVILQMIVAILIHLLLKVNQAKRKNLKRKKKTKKIKEK